MVCINWDDVMLTLSPVPVLHVIRLQLIVQLVLQIR